MKRIVEVRRSECSKFNSYSQATVSYCHSQSSNTPNPAACAVGVACFLATPLSLPHRMAVYSVNPLDRGNPLAEASSPGLPSGWPLTNSRGFGRDRAALPRTHSEAQFHCSVFDMWTVPNRQRLGINRRTFRLRNWNRPYFPRQQDNLIPHKPDASSVIRSRRKVLPQTIIESTLLSCASVETSTIRTMLRTVRVLPSCKPFARPARSLARLVVFSKAVRPISISVPLRMHSQLSPVNPPISDRLPSDSFHLLSEAEKSSAAEDALYQQQLKDVEAWWATPRFEGIKRPYTAGDVVSKRGSLQQSYPSSVMARKLWNLVQERLAKGEPLHTSMFTVFRSRTIVDTMF